MNKILYHGGFAALGISLLVGMAALQMNSRAPSIDSYSMDEAYNSPVVDSAPDESADSAALAVADKEEAPLPPIAKAPVQKVQATVAAVPVAMDSASALMIFASGKEAATQKTFSTTPNGIRNASAYVATVDHPVIKAQVDGTWNAISVSQFKKYVADAIGE